MRSLPPRGLGPLLYSEFRGSGRTAGFVIHRKFRRYGTGRGGDGNKSQEMKNRATRFPTYAFNRIPVEARCPYFIPLTEWRAHQSCQRYNNIGLLGAAGHQPRISRIAADEIKFWICADMRQAILGKQKIRISREQKRADIQIFKFS